jgi:hypothetical protein
MPRRGQVSKGRVVPYGTFNESDFDVRRAYYYYGYRHDEDMPELPCMPPELEPESCPEDEMYKKQLVNIVDAALKTISPRYEKVLRMRFGIDTGVDHTLEEVGDAFCVTKERIRQMEAKAMRLLKHPKRELDVAAFPEYRYKTTVQKRKEFDAPRQRWIQAEAEAQLAAEREQVMAFIDEIVRSSDA